MAGRRCRPTVCERTHPGSPPLRRLAAWRGTVPTRRRPAPRLVQERLTLRWQGMLARTKEVGRAWLVRIYSRNGAVFREFVFRPRFHHRQALTTAPQPKELTK